MDISKLNPWNWFKHEEGRDRGNVPVQRGNQTPAPAGWSSLMPLHREIDRLFDDVFRGFGLPGMGGGWPAAMAQDSVLRPNVDIDADDGEYRISVEIPGVEEKDVQVELSPDGSLCIRGEKRQEREDKARDVYRVERSYGAFERVLALPEDVDAERIKARFRNGVLTVQLPRRAELRKTARRIAIEDGGTTERRLAA